MPESFDEMVQDMKALSQNGVTLPVAEDEWDTLPDTVSYGMISLEMETDQLNANSLKTDVAYQGSIDLYSRSRPGAGWVPLITNILTEYCGACWWLNSHTYERDTGLFHWEWVFELEA